MIASDEEALECFILEFLLKCTPGKTDIRVQNSIQIEPQHKRSHSQMQNKDYDVRRAFRGQMVTLIIL